jgi:hypothetical protein
MNRRLSKKVTTISTQRARTTYHAKDWPRLMPRSLTLRKPWLRRKVPATDQQERGHLGISSLLERTARHSQRGTSAAGQQPSSLWPYRGADGVSARTSRSACSQKSISEPSVLPLCSQKLVGALSNFVFQVVHDLVQFLRHYYVGFASPDSQLCEAIDKRLGVFRAA